MAHELNRTNNAQHFLKLFHLFCSCILGIKKEVNPMEKMCTEEIKNSYRSSKFDVVAATKHLNLIAIIWLSVLLCSHELMLMIEILP